MKIGIVCPYSLDRPGGVQLHVTELASALIDQGHDVRVLAPANAYLVVPAYVDSMTGRPISIHYNGATARVTIGIFTALKVREWLREGNFDVVHVHEPGVPSVGLLAMWARVGPTVGTFHVSKDDSIVMRLAKPFVKPSMEVLDARIAVSPSADRTLQEHFKLAPTHVIPNGVTTRSFSTAVPRKAWQGEKGAPTVAILGRMDEPRKGMDDFLAMIPEVRKRVPGARFLVAGRFSKRTAQKAMAAGAEIVGELDENDKQRFMASVDVYCVPNTEGESFGIVLVEAMAAGTAVVASDLKAFVDVATAAEKEPAALIHRVGDWEHMAEQVSALLLDPAKRTALAKRGQKCAALFDWENVVPRVEETYRDAIRMNAE